MSTISLLRTLPSQMQILQNVFCALQKVSSIESKLLPNIIWRFFLRNCISVTENIDLTTLEDFTFQINQYMDENTPNQPDFKQYIRIICTYLAFIAKKPLHPLGMTFSNNQKIVSTGYNYYCPEKGKHTQETTSLCRYCICKPIVALPIDGVNK